MNTSLGVFIAIVILLIFLSSVFSSLETALTSTDPIKLKGKTQSKKNKIYTLASSWTDDMDGTLSKILVLNNIINSIYATLITLFITEKFGAKYLSLSILLSTIILFIFAEMLPKLLSTIFTEKILIITTILSYPFMKIIRPISDLFFKISLNILSLFSKKKSPESILSEDDVKSMVHNAINDGNLEDDAQELIERAFDFDDTTIYSIMEKWEDVAKLYWSDDPAEVYQSLKNQEFTRLPVVDENGDVLGLYNIKKFLQSYLEKGDKLDLKQVLFPAFYVQYNQKIDDCLKLLSQNRVHMAFVMMNKKVCGIVTIEDILEELVGEIKDEEE